MAGAVGKSLRIKQLRVPSALQSASARYVFAGYVLLVHASDLLLTTSPSQTGNLSIELPFTDIGAVLVPAWRKHQ
jgi:hypothetical protein